MRRKGYAGLVEMADAIRRAWKLGLEWRIHVSWRS
jgi:hypothetical protein